MNSLSIIYPAYDFKGSPDEPLSEPIRTELSDTALKILNEIAKDSHVTYIELSELLGVSRSAIMRNITKLKTLGKIKRMGGKKSGYWEITSI